MLLRLNVQIDFWVPLHIPTKTQIFTITNTGQTSEILCVMKRITIYLRCDRCCNKPQALPYRKFLRIFLISIFFTIIPIAVWTPSIENVQQSAKDKFKKYLFIEEKNSKLFQTKIRFTYVDKKNAVNTQIQTSMLSK